MASDLGSLSVKIGADTKDYVAGMAAAKSSLRDFADSIPAAVAAISALSASLVVFGREAIAAANLMDPDGAETWAGAVLKLKDAWLNFAGTLGKELRPVVESLMAGLVDLIHILGRIDLAKWAHDAAFAWGELKEMAAGFWEMFRAGAAGLANFVLSPLDAILKGLTEFIALAMEAAAKAQDLTHTGDSDATRKMAEQIRAVGAAGIVTIAGTVIEQAGKEAVSMVKAQVKTLADAYLKPNTGAKDKHVQDLSEIRAEGAGKMLELRERMKSDKEGAAQAQVGLEMAKQSASVEKEAAKESYDLGHKSYEDKVAMLRATQSADDKTAAAQATVLAAAKAKLEATKQEFDLDSRRAEISAKEKMLKHPAGNDPAVLARAENDVKLFRTQEQMVTSLQAKVTSMQAASDADHIRSMQAAAQIQIAASEEAARQRDSMLSQDDAQAQRKFDLSRQSASDQMDLLKAQAASDQLRANNADDFGSDKDQADAQAKMFSDQSKLLQQQQAYANAPGKIAGQGLMGAAGAAGGLVNGAISGGMEGGPAGAAASVATTLLTMSDAFKGVVAAVNGILPTIVNIAVPMMIIGNLFGPAGPLIALVAVFTALAPAITPMANAIKEIVSGPMDAVQLGLGQLGKLFGYLGESLMRAAEVFNPFRSVVEVLVQALAASFGPIIGKLGNGVQEVANIMQSALVPVLPLLELLFEDLASMLSGPLGTAMEFWFNAAMQFASNLMASLEGFDTVVYTVLGAINGVLYSLNGVAKVMGVDLGPVEKTIGDAFNAMKTGAYDAGMASQAFAQITWNSTSSLVALAVAADAANTQLTNLPASFNVAQAYNQAIASGAIGAGSTVTGNSAPSPYGGLDSHGNPTTGNGEAGSYTGDRGGEMDRAFVRQRGTSSGGTVVNIENLTVVASDPMSLFDDLANLNSAQGNGSTMAPTSRPARQELAFR